MNTSVIRAAGGVVWRRAEGASGEPSIELAVIHRPLYDDWTIPKGKLAPGESEVEGALREVLEETGLRVRLGRPLGHVRYLKTSAAGTRPKVVRYWAMEAEGGSFVATREVDGMRWVTPAEAMDLLTHERDRYLVEKLVRGPALPTSLLLVRHAGAVSRRSWREEDAQRPLTPTGWDQAQEVARLLARFDVEQLIASDSLRCVQTLMPYSEAVSLGIKPEPLLSTPGYEGREEEAIQLLRLYSQQSGATVLCAEGPVVADLLARLAVEDHIDIPLPPRTRKAGAWSLTFDGPRIFSAEYFAPPTV